MRMCRLHRLAHINHPHLHNKMQSGHLNKLDTHPTHGSGFKQIIKVYVFFPLPSHKGLCTAGVKENVNTVLYAWLVATSKSPWQQPGRRSSKNTVKKTHLPIMPQHVVLTQICMDQVALPVQLLHHLGHQDKKTHRNLYTLKREHTQTNLFL